MQTETRASWVPHPEETPLLDDHVHIWLANLDLELFSLPRYLRHLSLSERGRAQRLKFEHDRRRFVIAKGVLRHLIGRYLRIEPHDVQLAHGPTGKPDLSWRMQSRFGTLYFNQAHSAHLGIYAFCKNRPIGVDIEEIRVLAEMDQTAEYLFSERELSTFRALPEAHRHEAFFTGWTRKEAFVKALGKGLTLPLNHFEIHQNGSDFSRIVQNHAEPPTPLDWYLKDIPISPSFAAAVCVEGEGWKLRCWKW